MKKRRRLTMGGVVVGTVLVGALELYDVHIVAWVWSVLVRVAQWMATPVPVYGWILVVVLVPLSVIGLLTSVAALMPKKGQSESTNHNKRVTVDGVAWRLIHGDMEGFCAKCDMRLVLQSEYDDFRQIVTKDWHWPMGCSQGLFCERCERCVVAFEGYNRYRRQAARKIEWLLKKDAA